MNNFSVEKFKYLTQKKFNSIDGIPASEVVEITKSYIEELINDNGFDAGIVDIAIYGSRSRGLETPDSDIDVVFEYNGSEREDDLFNLLHSEELYIGNVPVDTNPIRKEESGSLSEYLQRADVYLRKKAESQKLVREQKNSFIKSLAKELYQARNGDENVENEKIFIDEVLNKALRDGELQTIAYLKDSLEQIRVRNKNICL